MRATAAPGGTERRESQDVPATARPGEAWRAAAPAWPRAGLAQPEMLRGRRTKLPSVSWRKDPRLHLPAPDFGLQLSDCFRFPRSLLIPCLLSGDSSHIYLRRGLERASPGTERGQTKGDFCLKKLLFFPLQEIRASLEQNGDVRRSYPP